MVDSIQLGALIGGLVGAVVGLALAVMSRRWPTGRAAKLIGWQRRLYRRALGTGTSFEPIDWRDILERPAPGHRAKP